MMNPQCRICLVLSFSLSVVRRIRNRSLGSSPLFRLKKTRLPLHRGMTTPAKICMLPPKDDIAFIPRITHLVCIGNSGNTTSRMTQKELQQSIDQLITRTKLDGWTAPLVFKAALWDYGEPMPQNCQTITDRSIAYP